MGFGCENDVKLLNVPVLEIFYLLCCLNVKHFVILFIKGIFKQSYYDVSFTIILLPLLVVALGTFFEFVTENKVCCLHFRVICKNLCYCLTNVLPL